MRTGTHPQIFANRRISGRDQDLGISISSSSLLLRGFMKMHLPVCTLAMLFTQRCYNMIMQTIELNRAFGVAGVA
jgi:hypothetical protein